MDILFALIACENEAELSEKIAKRKERENICVLSDNNNAISLHISVCVVY